MLAAIRFRTIPFSKWLYQQIVRKRIAANIKIKFPPKLSRTYEIISRTYDIISRTYEIIRPRTAKRVSMADLDKCCEILLQFRV